MIMYVSCNADVGVVVLAPQRAGLKRRGPGQVIAVVVLRADCSTEGGLVVTAAAAQVSHRSSRSRVVVATGWMYPRWQVGYGQMMLMMMLCDRRKLVSEGLAATQSFLLYFMHVCNDSSR